MGRSSAQPLLLAETFLVLEISLLRSSLEGREFIAMKYVCLVAFYENSTCHCPDFLEPKDVAGFQKEKRLDDFIIANNCSHQDKDSLITFPVQKYQGIQKGTFPFDFSALSSVVWSCSVLCSARSRL